MNHFDRPRASLLRADAANRLWGSHDHNLRVLSKARKAWPDVRPWVSVLCSLTINAIMGDDSNRGWRWSSDLPVEVPRSSRNPRVIRVPRLG